MATAFASTARDIIIDALDENAILPLGTAPEASELDKCLRRLNAMLKSWQQQGLLWKQETIEISGTADTATITLDASIRGVNGLRYIESATNERPIARWERDEYMGLPNKAASGTPTIYHVTQAEPPVLSVWPVPTANFTLSADIDRKIDTVASANDAIDIPEELTETVYTNLAVRCAGIFGTQAPPELAMRAQLLERQMLDAYRPASYQMGPW